MKLLHRTQSEHNNHRYVDYVDDGTTVSKVEVREYKLFDGRETSWERDETTTDSWSHDDPSMPSWLREKLGK